VTEFYPATWKFIGYFPWPSSVSPYTLHLATQHGDFTGTCCLLVTVAAGILCPFAPSSKTGGTGAQLSVTVLALQVLVPGFCL
jgi:hypothetical protein